MTRRARWLGLALGAGFALGLLLLVEAVVTFDYVARGLMVDYLTAEAGRIVTRLELRARDEGAEGAHALREVLERERADLGGQLVWIRVARQSGEVVAAAGEVPAGRVDLETMEEILDRRALNVHRALPPRWAPGLVVALPFRFQFEGERGARSPADGAVGRPRFKVVELALDPHGPRDPFRPLVRNLAVSGSAALALLAAIAALALLTPRYVRARRTEDQLDLARRVQERLLPLEMPAPSQLDIAARCIPTWGVGGDHYDLFEVDGKVGLIVGDVSGKGLPAAIIAGVLHGAVRAAAADTTGDLSGLAARLNVILEAQTDPNRFVTFFWGRYDLATSQLEYVNAGHLPPLLVRSGGDGEAAVELLGEGGPVLGLLPGAGYRAGHVALSPGDLLLLYSDGVTEATAPSGEEFGDERLRRWLLSARGQPSATIVERLLDELRRFTSGADFTDDLTLVAIRLRSE